MTPVQVKCHKMALATAIFHLPSLWEGWIPLAYTNRIDKRYSYYL